MVENIKDQNYITIEEDLQVEILFENMKEYYLSRLKNQINKHEFINAYIAALDNEFEQFKNEDLKPFPTVQLSTYFLKSNPNPSSEALMNQINRCYNIRNSRLQSSREVNRRFFTYLSEEKLKAEQEFKSIVINKTGKEEKIIKTLYECLNEIYFNITEEEFLAHFNNCNSILRFKKIKWIGDIAVLKALIEVLLRKNLIPQSHYYKLFTSHFQYENYNGERLARYLNSYTKPGFKDLINLTEKDLKNLTDSNTHYTDIELHDLYYYGNSAKNDSKGISNMQRKAKKLKYHPFVKLMYQLNQILR